MKKPRMFILFFILLAIPDFCLAQGGKEAVAGAWKLISFEAISPDGERKPTSFGKNPVGIVIYHPTGYVSVQYMRDPRPTFASGSASNATPEEMKSAFFGYYAYFGTYEVNEKEGIVVHHVQASKNPPEVGIDYKRSFKISGDRLTLTTPPQRTTDGSGMYVFELTWERVK